MSLPTGKWTLPCITGQPPPPCFQFTLTPVGERRAALFGGRTVTEAISDDLLIVELSRDADVVSVIVCNGQTNTIKLTQVCCIVHSGTLHLIDPSEV